MPARVLFALLYVLPIPVAATCEPGAAPSYGDITYIKISQFSLTGIRHPSFHYEATVIPSFGVRKGYATATLIADREVKFQGSFVAVDARRTFSDTVAVLERDGYFNLRLNPSSTLYIDGPEDAITAARCGISTTLGTVSMGGEIDLNDAQFQRFLQLEDDLRYVIFSERWVPQTPHP
ncbi:MAG: hypothetical protein JOY69_07625 [Candidatus Eremiobacteraeota bacterium]|nr:hypothetical protein [Candidatus Eremiobacteraeota bacterium]